MKYIIVGAFLMCTFLVFGQSDIILPRYPSLSPDGSQLAFSFQGDIWTVNSEGGRATRLTIHEAYEGWPDWSPDGTKLTFISERYGNPDIFTIDVKGGIPRQLTYFSGSDRYPKWADNQSIVFNSPRYFKQVEREYEIMQVPAAGGTPNRLLDALGNNPTVSPDGRYVAFEIGSCKKTREAYRGPANSDIWIYDTELNEYRQITFDDGQDIYPAWADASTLYFLSARNKVYNIYKIEVNDGRRSGEPQQVTKYSEEGIRYLDVSHDGSRLAFERGTDIYVMKSEDPGSIARCELEITRDYRFDPVEYKSMRDQVESFALSPNNKNIAMVVRGDIMVKLNDKEHPGTTSATHNPARDQNALWLNDSTLLFLSDRNGNRDIYSIHSVDTSASDLIRSFRFEIRSVTETAEEESKLTLSPDGKKLAFLRGRGKLIVADIDATGKISNDVTLHDDWNTPSSITWSPDSKWLAYSMSDLDFNREIFIQPADNHRPAVNVSLHPRPDRSPVWSRDGSKLGFLSERNNGDSDVWFVWLKKSDWQMTKQDWEEAPTEEDKPKKSKNDSTETAVDTISIDLEDIYKRLVQVTSLPGDESDLEISHDGEYFFYSTDRNINPSSGGKSNLMKVKWDGSEPETLIEGANVRQLTWDKDGKWLYYIADRGRINKVSEDKGKVEKLPFEARIKIDHRKENEYIFNDAWRALKNGFYDPQFHGRDWEALKDRYKERILAASTSQDFRYMFNEMLGQLDASHMGMYGPDPEETQKYSSGLLGLEFAPTGEGLLINTVVPNSPADREQSKIYPGETLTSINTTDISETTNVYELLLGTTNERTLLTLIDTNGRNREVIIRPSNSLNSERYNAWVEDRRRLVDRYSGGRLGYIHIRGMNWSSFEQFERELTASGYNKDGIVIDVRYNGGGWTTDMLMTILNVEQHAYTIPRGAAQNLEEQHGNFSHHYPYGERLPFPALMKPSIALCNQNSYSNAEIFSHAYKNLGIGTLVGTPTFGAVISTGSYRLVDGSRVRMPFRAWYVKATGENMEHGPAVPDVVVENSPDSKAMDEDPQLEEAVEMLLEQIRSKN